MGETSEIHHDNIDAPSEFICPISLCVMRDPVMTRDGKNFERKAIVAWLKRGHGSCPLTRKPLKPSLLVANANLQSKIEKWRIENGLDDMESDWSDDGDGILALAEKHCDFFGVLDIEGRPEIGADLTLRRIRHIYSRHGSVEDFDELVAMYREALALMSTPWGSSVRADEASLELGQGDSSSTETMDSPSQTRRWRPSLFRKARAARS